MKTKSALVIAAASTLAAFLAACGGPEDGAAKENGRDQPVDETPAGESVEEGDPSLKEELKKAGGHLKEAGKIAGEKAGGAAREAGDLLERGWGRVEDATHDAKDNLVEAYGDDLDEAKRRLAQWKQKAEGASDEQLEKLEAEIEKAREKLEMLKGATEENWDATKGAFGVGWEGLKGAFKDAKEEFEERRK